MYLTIKMYDILHSRSSSSTHEKTTLDLDSTSGRNKESEVIFMATKKKATKKKVTKKKVTKKKVAKKAPKKKATKKRK